MPWKVLYVASRSEKKVAEKLHELGIESYLPLKTEMRQWSDRKQKIVTPLISGYVFLNINEKFREQVFKVSGVVNYVRSNGNDAIVKDKEIEILKAIEEKGYFAELTRTDDIKKHDLVEIMHGPFKGIKGRVLSVSTHSVFVTQFESIDFELSIQLPKEVVVKKAELI